MDKITNEDIRKELRIMPILGKMRNYRTQWKEHLEWMDRNRIQKQPWSTSPKETEEDREKGIHRNRLIAFNHDDDDKI